MDYKTDKKRHAEDTNMPRYENKQDGFVED